MIEVKHWDMNYILDPENMLRVNRELDQLTARCERVGSNLRRVNRDLGFVDGALLVASVPDRVRKGSPKESSRKRGAGIPALGNWKSALGVNRRHQISDEEVRSIGKARDARVRITLEVHLGRLCGYGRLQLVDHGTLTYHRAYRGFCTDTDDKVLLHLYDLSVNRATADEASWEFEALN